MDLYVYYRALQADATTIQSEVAVLQQRMRREHGVRCGLKQRPRVGDERDTWMEIYLAAPVGFEAVLAAAVAASPLQQRIDGERHVEHFLDCLPCA